MGCVPKRGVEGTLTSFGVGCAGGAEGTRTTVGGGAIWAHEPRQIKPKKQHLGLGCAVHSVWDTGRASVMIE